MEDYSAPLKIPSLRIANGTAIRNGSPFATAADAASMYRMLSYSYPKFFKMDGLCKWAWLGAEALLQGGTEACLYDGVDKRGIAVVLATADGCLEVDHRYAETMQTIPSPALFVYTLPNIMLGEICIRHSFTGEQLCEMQEAFDPESMLTTVQDLLENRGVTHCLFGWVDAANAYHDVCLFWADQHNITGITARQLQAVYINAAPPQRY